MQNSVSVLSIHQSKGLEWPFVFVVRCNDGVCPMTTEFSALSEVAEERYLCMLCTAASSGGMSFSWALVGLVQCFNAHPHKRWNQWLFSWPLFAGTTALGLSGMSPRGIQFDPHFKTPFVSRFSPQQLHPNRFSVEAESVLRVATRA